jgi:cytochrome c-type biogenesis protein CcmH/NrfF
MTRAFGGFAVVAGDWINTTTVPLWLFLLLGLGYCGVWWWVRITRARKRTPAQRQKDTMRIVNHKYERDR